MASSAASIHFLSVNPQSLPHSKLNSGPTSLSLFCFPASSSVKRSLSLSCSVRNSLLGSRVLRNVAFSDQIEEVDDFEDEIPSGGGYSDEPSFSPELKLFVGNLPFSVESATLAGLFSQAGSVEMAEV